VSVIGLVIQSVSRWFPLIQNRVIDSKLLQHKYFIVKSSELCKNGGNVCILTLPSNPETVSQLHSAQFLSRYKVLTLYGL
jgi:hypothetical protein